MAENDQTSQTDAAPPTDLVTLHDAVHDAQRDVEAAVEKRDAARDAARAAETPEFPPHAETAITDYLAAMNAQREREAELAVRREAL